MGVVSNKEVEMAKGDDIALRDASPDRTETRPGPLILTGS